MSPSPKGRSHSNNLPDLIASFGARDATEAVRIVNASSLPRRHPVRFRDLIGYLEGRSIKDLAQDGAVSPQMIHIRISAGARQVKLEQVSAGAPDQLIRSLSVRASNCLFNDNLTTDQAVRDHVQGQGAMSLLMAPNMGRKSYREVCETFGFDPADPARTAEKSQRSVLAPEMPAETSRESGPLQTALLKTEVAAGDAVEPWDPYL